MRRSRKMMNQINVVPYIDVMLVLLVIFMVTAPMIQSGQVDLPSVGKTSQPAVSPMEVLIKADGKIEMRDLSKGAEFKGLSLPQLADATRQRQQQNPEQAVVIAADKAVKYEEVMKVMDLLQREGVAKVGLLVKVGK